MSGAAKLLLVDDDEDLRGALADQLGFEAAFEVAEAGTGAAALEAAGAERFDLMILDVGLPDMDGRDLCAMLRQRGFGGPIIMLTAQDSDDDTVRGLEAGANDYVAKPMKLSVLLARIRAQLRAHETSENAVFRLGRFIFSPAQKTLEDETGARTRLTEKEANILKYLYRAGGAVVPRETLLSEVWGYSAGVTTHTLETHIYRLRQKVDAEKGSRMLVTEGGGYRLAL